MLKRTLGKSGIEVSAVGMGCWAIGGPWTWHNPGEESWPAGWGKVDDDESTLAIHAAIDLGVNLFDTAANYGAGHSERVLGEALKGRRDQVVILTKFGHMVNEETKVVYRDDDQILGNVRTDVENSLRRLQTDYIDVYQLHQASYDPDLALELRGVLEDLVEQGKIRWYGWSTDLVDRAEIFAEGEQCTSIQFSLNAIFDNEEMRELCAAQNVAGINKDPLNRGVLTGKFTENSTFPEDDVRHGADFHSERLARRLELIDALREPLTAGGRSMAQGALSYIWAIDPNMIPIPGFKTVEQVRQNAGAADFGPLGDEEARRVRELVADADLPT